MAPQQTKKKYKEYKEVIEIKIILLMEEKNKYLTDC